MGREPISEQLNQLFAMRNALFSSSNLDALIGASVSLARIRVNAQTASLFLFSKDGLLERKLLDGIDKMGNAIESDWFKKERHIVGTSFTGKAAEPVGEPPVGQPQWTSSLLSDELDSESREQYLNKLGRLDCAVAVPLNGTSKPLGVLEVINKLNHDGKPVANGRFSQAEVFWLSLIGVTAGAAISILRRQDQLSLLTDISWTITGPLLENEDPHATYERIASKLTGPLTSYKACIIRIGTSPDQLEIVARGGDRLSWDSRSTTEIDSRMFYTKVLIGGERILVEDIEARSGEFVHLDWARKNNLRAFVCIPLKLKSKVVGTLSLYMGSTGGLEFTELSFIENIALLLACLAENFHIAGALRLEEATIESERERVLSGARAASYDNLLTQLQHKQNNFLIRVKEELQKAVPHTGGRGAAIIEAQLKNIAVEIDSVADQFATARHARVNLNAIAQNVVKYFVREMRHKGIRYRLELDSDLPDIEASEAELRDVAVNLVSNAIKAIEKATPKDGEIVLSTRLGMLEKREVIELIVEDNGTGVRNDDKQDIFKPGFSRVGGTGMGLFITAGIVQHYGGKIVVESSIGRGARFIVKLPLQQLLWQTSAK